MGKKRPSEYFLVEELKEVGEVVTVVGNQNKLKHNWKILVILSLMKILFMLLG